MPRRPVDHVLRSDEGAGELLERFRASLDPDWIDEALEATGTATVRRRRLPAEQVVWLVLGMGIYRNKPITARSSPSSISRSRDGAARERPPVR